MLEKSVDFLGNLSGPQRLHLIRVKTIGVAGPRAIGHDLEKLVGYIRGTLGVFPPVLDRNTDISKKLDANEVWCVSVAIVKGDCSMAVRMPEKLRDFLDKLWGPLNQIRIGNENDQVSKGHLVDALACTGDEGRDTLR